MALTQKQQREKAAEIIAIPQNKRKNLGLPESYSAIARSLDLTEKTLFNWRKEAGFQELVKSYETSGIEAAETSTSETGLTELEKQEIQNMRDLNMPNVDLAETYLIQSKTDSKAADLYMKNWGKPSQDRWFATINAAGSLEQETLVDLTLEVLEMLAPEIVINWLNKKGYTVENPEQS